MNFRKGQPSGYAMVKRLFIFLLISTIGMISACKDDEPTIKQLKFEVNGNYTGQMNVVISQVTSDNVTTQETYLVTSMPWTMTITFPDNTAAVGIAASSVPDKPGLDDQAVRAIIYKGSSMVQVRSAETNPSGAFNLPGFVYQF